MYFLTLHTVFILNENIAWLEEYIQYYINLGVEHFYFYDNSGSATTKKRNKYGFEIVENIDVDINTTILEKYKTFITYIVWQPKNSRGEIIYGQIESVKDCLKRYGATSEWIAFLDLDEFIFSEKNINLVDYLKNVKDISCIKLTQKKFLDRHLTNKKLITQEFSCIDNFKIGTEWAPKNIVKPRDFKSAKNIHTMFFKKKILVPSSDLLRFNHYNVNEKQFRFIKSFYGKNLTLNGLDEGMKRYESLFN